MSKSILVFILAAIASTLAVGCIPSTLPTVAFEPREYPSIAGPINRSSGAGEVEEGGRAFSGR
jgi:hypothetical protein